MSRAQKRALVLGLLAVAALAIYFALMRGTSADTAAVAPSSAGRIEPSPRHDTTPRPLDRDFKAAMERDSQAAARGSGAAR